MSRPSAKTVLEIGNWRLLYDKHGYTLQSIKNPKNRYWPTGLQAALTSLYEKIVMDNRFSADTKNDIVALRDGIIMANESFSELLTPKKAAEISEIVREVDR